MGDATERAFAAVFVYACLPVCPGMDGWFWWEGRTAANARSVAVYNDNDMAERSGFVSFVKKIVGRADVYKEENP